MSGGYQKYLAQYFHLTLCIFLLTTYTYESFSTEVDWTYVVWIALGTFLVYNYHPIINVPLKEFTAFFKKNLPLYILVIISGVLGLFIILGDLLKLLAGFIASVSTYIYFKAHIIKGRSGREIYYLKPFLIGIVYGMMTMFVPAQDAGLDFMESVILTIGRITFISALALIFDICDISEDIENHFSTLPEKIGTKLTKSIIAGLLIISFFTESWAIINFITELEGYVGMIFTLIMSLAIARYAHRQRPIWYSLFMTDSMMLLPYVIMLFAQVKF